MRKTGFRRFFVMFAKVAGRVKKLLGDDGRLELYVAERVEHGFAARSGDAGADVDHVVESLARGFEAQVSAPEQRTHVRRDKSIGHAVENRFLFNVAQVESACRVQIDDLLVAKQRADSGLVRGVLKGHKLHWTSPAAAIAQILLRETDAGYYATSATPG